jgi:hypothetical protein
MKVLIISAENSGMEALFPAQAAAMTNRWRGRDRSETVIFRAGKADLDNDR